MSVLGRCGCCDLGVVNCDVVAVADGNVVGIGGIFDVAVDPPAALTFSARLIDIVVPVGRIDDEPTPGELDDSCGTWLSCFSVRDCCGCNSCFLGVVSMIGFFENAVGCGIRSENWIAVGLVCWPLVMIKGVELESDGVFIIIIYTVLGGFIIAGALGLPLLICSAVVVIPAGDFVDDAAPVPVLVVIPVGMPLLVPAVVVCCIVAPPPLT